MHGFRGLDVDVILESGFGGGFEDVCGAFASTPRHQIDMLVFVCECKCFDIFFCILNVVIQSTLSGFTVQRQLLEML